MRMVDDPPPGFEPLFRTIPFLDHLGPFFMRKQADGTFVVGVRILPHHANGRGGAHGGLLMTLCDIALGYRTTSSVEPRPMLTTASITTDFAGSAKVVTGSRRMSTSTRWRPHGLRQLLHRARRRAHRSCQRRVRPQRRPAG